ncbi:MAG: tripartite tricarboxylate transporter substrate binding protein [Xanthobacteraceae bacterium]|nr:tripartite tricarboxylate transporter substrate binding protein [Xanthobacteraceae bacterium]
MTLSRRRFLRSATCVAALPIVPRTAWAQAYPARPVRLIVPFAPGGPTDVFARLIAAKMSEQTGKQFYIENVSGAGGNAGSGRAAQSPPDGYTVLVTGGGHVNNPFLYSHVPYDPFKDFDAVTLGASQPVVLTVHPSVPAQSVKELIALVKANPGKYSFASPGVGTPPQLVGELFRMSLAPDLIHVPFNGGGPAIGSTVAGHTPTSFGALTPAVPLVKDGKLRALAVTSKARAKALPDVPTMAEAGYPDVEGASWAAVVVPAGTPREIIVQLQRMIGGIVVLPDVKERLDALGFEPVVNTPDECTAFFKAESAKWSKVIKAAGLRAD